MLRGSSRVVAPIAPQARASSRPAPRLRGTGIRSTDTMLQSHTWPAGHDPVVGPDIDGLPPVRERSMEELLKVLDDDLLAAAQAVADLIATLLSF